MNSIENRKRNSPYLRNVLFGVLCLIVLVATSCSKSANQAGTQSTQTNAKQTGQDETQMTRNIPPTSGPNAPEAGGQPPGQNTQQGAPGVAGSQSDDSKESLNQVNEAQLLVGIWHYQVQYNGYPCQGEDIYQANGSYSAQWNCSGSMTWQTGNWYYMQPGVIRRQILNYEPKEFRGVRIRMPEGETVQFRFLDYNRMVYADNTVLFRAG